MRFYIFSSSLVFIWNDKTDSRSPTIFFCWTTTGQPLWKRTELTTVFMWVLSTPLLQTSTSSRPLLSDWSYNSKWQSVRGSICRGGGRGPPPDNTRAGGRKPTVSFSSRCPWGDWSGRLVRVSRCTEVTARHVTLDLESRLGTSSVQRENGYK